MSLRSATTPLPGGYLGIEHLGESLGVEAWKALPADSSGPVFWKGCPHTTLGPEVLALVREAEALRELPDAGLVKPIHDASREEWPHLVFPWVKGTTHSSRPQGYVPSQVLGVLREAAEKVHRVHRFGWVHADIRPENLFWSHDGIKLIDFGLARRIGEIADQPAVHSPDFLAPEARKPGYSWHPSADWYALGKTAHRWLGLSAIRRVSSSTPRKSLANLSNGSAAPKDRAQEDRDLGGKSSFGSAPAGFWDWLGLLAHENPQLRPKAARIISELLTWEVEWLGRGQ